MVKTGKGEKTQEAVTALKGVASSYAGRELSDEELKGIARDVERDEEAQSAIQAITGSLEGESPNIKYSPATGKRYSGELEYDPETGVKLIPIGEEAQ